MVKSWDGRGARRGGSTCDHGLVGKDALQPGNEGGKKYQRVLHGKGIGGGLDAGNTVQCHSTAARCLALHYLRGWFMLLSIMRPNVDLI